MKVNGVLPEVKALKPGPPKTPRTFCEPCPIITAASPRRIGIVIQTDEVAIKRRNMMIASHWLVKQRERY
jgi:hypothetical protein